jgi:hypothetical protein
MNQFDALYRATLDEMNRALTSFMEKIPQPQPMLFGGLVAYRFKEHDLLQAIVQKLARVISGLSATSLLLNNGYLQEHGAIQRMLDEFQGTLPSSHLPPSTAKKPTCICATLRRSMRRSSRVQKTLLPHGRNGR